MKPFEEHYEREVLESLKRDSARNIKAWERRQRYERQVRRTKAVMWVAVIVWAVFTAWILTLPPRETAVESVPVVETEPAVVAALILNEPAPEIEEDFENEKIEAALLEQGYFRDDVPLDYDTQALLRAACEEFGVEYELALAMIWRETTFRNVVGDGGESYGYMQVQPRWHAERMERLGVTDLMDPLGNFRVGCDYMAELLEKYELPEALTAYNTGSPGHNQYAADVIGYMEGLV